MKKTAIGSLIFFVISMSVIFYLSAEKVITVENVAHDAVEEMTGEAGKEMDSDEKILTFVIGEADTGYLRVPLPQGCKADDIMIENHYMNRELWLFIPTTEENFYADNPISGNRQKIRQGKLELSEEGCRLIFQLTGLYECRTILENNHLYIDFLPPKEVYDKIVVIDPACGGTDVGAVGEELQEKDITFEIARNIKEKLDDSDIKVYYTRMSDTNPSEAERIALANDAKADMYIRIEVSAEEDSAVYGTETVYNGDYFIPGFGSVELADCLEREVVTSIKGKAIGLKEADKEDYAISHATVPAAAVCVGYITNRQEAILLGRKEYREKIATGICNAIAQVYTSGH